MKRREFLSAVGIGAATAACSYCFNGCTIKDNGITAPSNIDFTLDLTNASYSALKQQGGYVVYNGVIVASTPGGFVALSDACTHQGAPVFYDLQSNSFICPSHGSVFGTNGSVLKGPASAPLGTYHTSLKGNSLRVYS